MLTQGICGILQFIGCASILEKYRSCVSLFSGVVRVAFTIPATSGPRERISSLAGLVRAKWCSWLSPGLLEALFKVGDYVRHERTQN